MKIDQIKVTDIPTVPTRNGLIVRNVDLNALKDTGLGLVSYGLSKGDHFEFPSSAEDCKIVARQVRKDSSIYEMLVLGLKNGCPAYFSISNLRRRDYKMRPVHPVAESLASMDNDQDRLTACFGRSIIAGEDVRYLEAVFVNGTRTNETRERITAKLEFV